MLPECAAPVYEAGMRTCWERKQLIKGLSLVVTTAAVKPLTCLFFSSISRILSRKSLTHGVRAPPAPMELQPLIEELPTKTAGGIWFEPQPKEEYDSSEYVIYMIPGNPCLMTYYKPFLSTLFSLLNDGASFRTLSAHVGGYTLPGFESEPVRQISGVTLPASLRSQIRNTEELIKVGLDSHIHQNAANKSTRPPKIILIAHSVGAYIALEILRRRAQGQNDLSKVDIIGGVFICPTVVDIAQSTHGAIVNVRIQFIVPNQVRYAGVMI